MNASAQLPISEAAVYVVDRDTPIRDAHGQLLKSAGYSVVFFNTVKDFLAANPSSASACVVADIRTPGFDGLQLQEQVVARNLGLPVILITGQEDIPLAVRAMRVGAIDFLEKPFEEKRLLDSVASALQGKNPLTDDEAKAAVGAMKKLTSREKEVLDLLVTGYADNIIARRTNISPPTVAIHRGRVMEKMKMQNMANLVRTVLALK